MISTGLPFAEAIRAWSDPGLWSAYEEAMRAAAGKRHAGYFVVGGVPIVGWDLAARIRRDNVLVAVHDRAWHAVLQVFLEQLLSDEVVASGIVVPPTLASEREFIPSERWRLLRLKRHGWRAEGEGLVVIDLLFHPRKEIEKGALTLPPPGAIAPASTRDELSSPGRPSMMPRIAGEMQRRAKRGELCGRLAAECRALRGWAETQTQGESIPRADSIRKALSSLYWRLKAEINADKRTDI